MATRPATFRTVSPTTTAPAQRTAPRDLERILVLGAFAAQLLAMVFHAGLAGFVSPQTAPMLLPGLVGAALLAWRVKRWTFVAAGALLALLPLMVLLAFGAVMSLGNPASGAEYTSLMLLLAALLLAVPAAWAGARRERLGQPLAEPGRRFGATLLAATFLLGAMVSGALASQHLAGSAGMGYDFAPEATARVVAQDFAFAEEPVRVEAGAITELVVENRDGAFHTFTYTVGGQTYNHDLAGHATARFLVKLDEPGTLQYWCAPHSSGEPGAKRGMVGELVVA